MTIQSFNFLTLQLQGTLLIEASAGTGKTYTLIALYLRLLLGIGENQAYPRILSVEEILVVTFTESATEELKCRIRENIQQLRLACIRGNSENTLLSALLEQINDRRIAVLHLLAAERQIDKAAIYTIHGFCQRMLNDVDSGILLKQTLIEDEYFLRQQVSADFWRRHCYQLPMNVARIVHNYWKGPAELLAEILPYLQGEPPLLCNQPDIHESLLVQHERIITSINNLKQQWRDIASNMRNIIHKHKLDRRVYSNNNLTFWLDKINRWSYQPTVDYQVPNELKRFHISVLAKTTNDGDPPKYRFFATVEAFYKQNSSLRELILAMALKEMRSALAKEKHRRKEIGFDDLIDCIDKALVGSGGEVLAESVRKRYLVAMIDEFQDTDPQQYRIFSRIYSGRIGCSLVLIGDPKQAIYAFRGADIFTYMRARREIDAHYTLDTNWRSAPGIVNAVNNLFKRMPAPFIFSEIPFFPVIAAESNDVLRLIIHRKPQSAMRFWLHTGSIGLTEYKHCMARQCAATIRNFLYASHEREAWLEGHRGRKLLQASDMTVLVRNSNEAALVSKALSALMIPSVYLSNRVSVFETSEARELQWILQAVLTPDKDTALRRALVTNLLGFNADDIYALNNDESCWEQLVEDFTNYRQCWQHSSIQAMLRQIMIKYRIAENLLAIQGGKRRLTNFLHLGELLQEASMQLENEYSLVRWLSIKRESPNLPTENQQLRIESDHNLVKIITVHKSKGLEFPLVFLPFATIFQVQNSPLFHDRDTYRAWLDLSASRESLLWAEEERLAEDLRMLYVALTRSIYHCSLGIAPIYYGNCRKNNISDLHLSALGYLIQKNQPGDKDYLNKQLSSLVSASNGDITLCNVLTTMSVKPLATSAAFTLPLSTHSLPELVQDPWLVTSYSGLQKKNSKPAMELLPNFDVDVVEESIEEQETLQLTPHTFPRGALAGTFLHSLFEKILDLNQQLYHQWISNQLLQKGIDSIWLSVIIHWIEKIITMPLDGISLSLKNITSENRNIEMKFYLPIDNLIRSRDMDLVCKSYDPLSALCPPLDCQQIKGMLTGFIDLVFHWKNRYYLLDYKSNWLGTGSSAYTRPAMEKVIMANRYELQYQIYTLALHRFLRHRLASYDYKRNFGGVYYLFLRGIDAEHPGNGIFYCRPDISLIEGLDTLFTNKRKLTE